MSRMWQVLSFSLLIVATLAAVAAPAGAKNQVERPYKAAELAVITINFDSCDGPVCAITTDGTGTASHLGKISSTGDGFVTFTGSCTLSDGSPGTAFTAQGDFTITAANGDMLFATYENGGCADGDGVIPGIIEGSQTILDGTGRFEGASGSTRTFGDNVGPLFSTGTLTY